MAPLSPLCPENARLDEYRPAGYYGPGVAKKAKRLNDAIVWSWDPDNNVGVLTCKHVFSGNC